jgi:molybdenum cofactor synthesis domain-containing protein
VKKGLVVSISISAEKGVRKTPVESAKLCVEHGIEGDAHAGAWHRQVSLLAVESIDKMKAAGLDVGFGDFAENITTQGLVLYEIPVGTRLRIGDNLLEVTQIGKECHDRCAIYYAAGDCVMPREGIFARVLQGGIIKKGDEIIVEDDTRAATVMRTAILTISDKGSRGEREDKSGAAIREMIEEMGGTVVEMRIVPDEKEQITSALKEMARSADLVLTTGGTGIAPRDVTPEATRAVIEKELPGITEVMRSRSVEVAPTAMLSRAVAGTLGRALIVNLPGSPKAVRECLSFIKPAIPHALELLRGEGGECGHVQ